MEFCLTAHRGGRHLFLAMNLSIRHNSAKVTATKHNSARNFSQRMTYDDIWLAGPREKLLGA